MFNIIALLPTIHSVPAHAVESALSSNPAPQLAQLWSPFVAQFTPDDATPLGHKHALATHSFLEMLRLQPTSQPVQLWAPSVAHFGPDDANPFGHRHLLAMHSLLSSFTFQPVLQRDTSHPDV